MEDKTRSTDKKTGRKSLFKDKRGLSTVEYIIILVLIAASGIGIWSEIGEKLTGQLKSASGKLDDVHL